MLISIEKSRGAESIPLNLKEDRRTSNGGWPPGPTGHRINSGGSLSAFVGPSCLKVNEEER